MEQDPTARAYATAAPRAPDGLGNPYRSGSSDRCSVLPPVARRQIVRILRSDCFAFSFRLRPCRSTQAQRCQRRLADLAVTSDRRPGCFVAGRESPIRFLCERPKQNAPGAEPEGVREASGDRGDRSPVRGDQSGMTPSSARRWFAGAHASAPKFSGFGSRRSAMCGIRKVMVCSVFSSPSVAKVAHDTPLKRTVNRFPKKVFATCRARDQRWWCRRPTENKTGRPGRPVRHARLRFRAVRSFRPCLRALPGRSGPVSGGWRHR